MTDGPLDQERVLLVAKLYGLGRVSLGVAAEIAGMDRLTLLGQLATYGVPAINLQDEEVTREIDAARRLAGEVWPALGA